MFILTKFVCLYDCLVVQYSFYVYLRKKHRVRKSGTEILRMTLRLANVWEMLIKHANNLVFFNYFIPHENSDKLQFQARPVFWVPRR